MKRWIFKLVVFLFIGAIVNVAVAWGCAIWSEASLGSNEIQTATWKDLERLQEAGWNRTSETDNWMYTHSIHTWVGFGVSELHLIERAVPQPDARLEFIGSFIHDFYIACISQTGWPFRCLAMEHLDTSGNGEGTMAWHGPWHPSRSQRLNIGGSAIDRRYETLISDWQFSMSIELPEKLGPIELPEKRRMPLRPIWGGLIVNTFIYALILWLMMFIASMAKQHRRFKKGHCPKCNYELRRDYSSGCPECGWGREAEA